MPWDFTGVTPNSPKFFAARDSQDWQSIFTRVLNRDYFVRSITRS